MSDTVKAWIAAAALQLAGDIQAKTATAPAYVRSHFSRPSECDAAIVAEIVKIYGLGNSSAVQAA